MKYTDYTIYNFLSNYDLLSLMLTTKKLRLNDEYFKYRIRNYYGKNIIELNSGISFKQQYSDIVSFLYKEYNEEKLYTRLDLMMIAKEKGWYPSKQQFNKIVSLNCPEFICQVMNLFGLEICDDRQLQNNYVKFEHINTLDSAIYTGNLKTAKWLFEMYAMIPTDEIYRFICEEKHIEIIEWIYKEFGKLPHINFKIRSSVIQRIIELDNEQFRIQYDGRAPIGCVTLFYENGYMPLNQDTLDRLIGENAKHFKLLNETDLRPSENALYFSIANSNMESLIKLADEHTFRYNMCISTLNLQTLQFLSEKYNVIPPVNIVNHVCDCGELSSLKFIYEKFNILPDRNFYHRDVKILKWLYDKMTIPINQAIVNKFAPTASIELLKFYYDKYNLLPSKDTVTKMKEQANFAGLNWCFNQLSLL